MIKQNTVFVLGAGASKHYGYPTGEELRNEIIMKFKVWYLNHIMHANPLTPWLESVLIINDKIPENVKTFIQDFDDSGDQIDIFITRNSHNKEYNRLGKLAIILSIIESEWKSKFPNDNKDWYRELLNQLTDGRTEPDDFRISQNTNKVSFITFNYDRSLEHYLHYTLQRKFKYANPSDISEEINSIPIIHVYGMVASLEWQDNSTNIHQLSYNINKNMPLGIDADEMSKNIFVMHNNRDNPNVEESKNLLRQANSIYFLGFGYLKENMEILDIPNTIEGATRIYGTAHNFSDQYVDNLIARCFRGIPIRRGRGLFIENRMKCNDLIFNYPLPTD